MTGAGANREIFGQIAEGNEADQSVYRVRLSGGGLTANILTWGATVQDLRLAGHEPPLVLGFKSFDHYQSQPTYFGATVGRYANRIGGASFQIDGNVHKTDLNDRGKNTLHGGSNGYFNRLWQIADLGTSHVYLTLNDDDGSMGFPGNCEATCNYTLKDDGVLQIVYTTRCDAPTPAGLAHHSYFTLDDRGNCSDDTLQILAQAYLPVDEELIPTGEIKPVGDTPFDFWQPKSIGKDLKDADFYDHNFCLAEARRGLQDVAIAHSNHSNVELTVATTEPGLQFYAGHGLNQPEGGLLDKPYGALSGFCLETQNWPDAPNHKNFPNAILKPGEELRQVTEYRFSKLR